MNEWNGIPFVSDIPFRQRQFWFFLFFSFLFTIFDYSISLKWKENRKCSTFVEIHTHTHMYTNKHTHRFLSIREQAVMRRSLKSWSHFVFPKQMQVKKQNEKRKTITFLTLVFYSV